MYRQRLEDAPKVEQEYLALARDYQNASAKHQEVMNKILEARISEGMEEGQKGEKFTLIDPASFPEKPVSPKRWLIFLAGVIMSLGVGFGTVALAEHLDHSVKNSDELARLTGLPVLGSIMRIQTRRRYHPGPPETEIDLGGYRFCPDYGTGPLPLFLYGSLGAHRQTAAPGG